jgi:hypothetical protein
VLLVHESVLLEVGVHGTAPGEIDRVGGFEPRTPLPDRARQCALRLIWMACPSWPAVQEAASDLGLDVLRKLKAVMVV